MSVGDGDEGVGYNRQNLDASLQLQHDAEVQVTPVLQTTSCFAGLKTDFTVAAARAERWQGVKQRPLVSTSLSATTAVSEWTIICQTPSWTTHRTVL